MGDDAGLVFRVVEPGVTLVEVFCALGAYQPSAVRIRFDERSGAGRAVVLRFPVYTTVDDAGLALGNEVEVWGDSAAANEGRELIVLTLARQTRDCGSWSRYDVTGEEPRLVEAFARVPCPKAAGRAVQLSANGPPSGWRLVSRKG